MSRHPSTCLSNKPHDGRVSDITIHFNGCLRVSKQKRFFDSLAPESQQRILRDNDKTAELRHRLETAQCDSTAATRLRDFKQAMSQWCASTGRPHVSYTPSSAFSDSRRPSGMAAGGYPGSEDLVNDHIKVPVVYFKDGSPHQVAGLPNSFPNQKVTVSDLLSEDEKRNPLLQPCEENTVRYFHLPANNMIWVEEAMARYYREKRPDPDDLFMNSKLRRSRTKTEMLLRPEYWQGQQNYDGDDEVHARHMRPFCDAISVTPSPETRPKNLALFMPYLHWETDRGRVQSAEAIKEVEKQKLLRTMSEVVNQAQHQLAHTQTNDTTAPVWVAPQPSDPGDEKADRRRALGQLLRTAAALLEAMDFHTEEQLMFKYLHAQPPLHPRRTLDQSYYGALKSTRARDRDQVVYRGTMPEPHQCVGMDACEQCNDDIRKVPRIVMVDQLWLWILDENTIITSFPRRWGKNRPDPSAVHKALRLRFKYASQGQISSAYDVALMIVDECSRVFFDRASNDSRKPNLIDLFTGAVRDLSYKQTAAFDQFLIKTHLASRGRGREGGLTNDAFSTHNMLLNINPEGNLLKEVKDIVDEMHIMIRIKEQQQAVMESLVKHIRRAASPLARAEKTRIASQASTPWDLVLGAPDSASPTPHQTLLRVDNLLPDLATRLSELRNLLQTAQNTSAALKDILTLKQQQASVIEARTAVTQASLTLRQGQSIMIFTTVTIIFLPLSFFVGLFGMGALPADLSFTAELTLMFPISAGIILVSLVFAFSQTVFDNSLVALVGSAVSLVWNTAATWVLVQTGLYAAGRRAGRRARGLREREGRVVGGMKGEAMRRELRREVEAERGRAREVALQMAVRRGEGGRMVPASPYSSVALASPFGMGKGEVDVELGERTGGERTGRRLV
ncbi:hypothetical protein B0T25DRAFT_224469 [Lasiosphaeria hispida]|uniref:Uncharacterized protein n=1 Tax=Lasiosphaeria hispida TaxID=260671 RepID=A0AAJ0MEZ8_9PEZI|nr:hypothetical protein B0T25DRAFT_224469 [Lasiosphaeria hispida]